jgi:hypothetical protein
MADFRGYELAGHGDCIDQQGKVAGSLRVRLLQRYQVSRQSYRIRVHCAHQIFHIVKFYWLVKRQIFFYLY